MVTLTESSDGFSCSRLRAPMIGAVIVRPPDGATDRAWDGGPTFDEEVLWQPNAAATAQASDP